MALKTDANFEGKLTCAFKNDTRTLADFHMLGKSNFVLESKMVDLNQSQNSKQPDFISPRKWMNTTANKMFYACSAESLFSRYKKISKKAVMSGSFLQCLVHILEGHDDSFLNLKNFESSENLRILWNNIMGTFK